MSEQYDNVKTQTSLTFAHICSNKSVMDWRIGQTDLVSLFFAMESCENPLQTRFDFAITFESR